MPPVRLEEDARLLLEKYRWPGNIRQLKNITEQISIIESQRILGAEILRNYLPQHAGENLPALMSGAGQQSKGTDFSNEREILYKVLFDMKRDVNDLKKLVFEMMQHGENFDLKGENAQIIQNLYHSDGEILKPTPQPSTPAPSYPSIRHSHGIEDTEEFVEESLSLEDKEIELIEKALGKHSGKRKNAAQELGISERTLYRKIKEYGIKS
jgi:transcriptional regulator with PAS, ATPase and Fis domain